jgi:predicted nucleic acid-binding protein
VLYLDTAAFLKLLVREDHTDHLRAALGNAEMWSSTLLAVEAHRAATRLGLHRSAVDDLLATVSLVLPGDATYFRARTIGVATLRSLDALHLASAVELGDELEGLVTYDRRLASGADEIGLTVLSPGQPARWWATD